ncbi:type IV secretion system DNA-binding domain-containing protein [Methylomagnum sp.]
MNLFVESLTNYLKSEWKTTLTDPDGPKEARFILQSFDPDNTFALFAALEAYRQEWTQRHTLECHFRVATKLWKAWGGKGNEAPKLDRKMSALRGLGPNNERLWIDEDDRLAHYRNCPKPDGVDGLVVVLVGYEHASDQGSLADFHRVDESRVWQQAMGETFEGWIRRLSDRHGLEITDPEIDRFKEVLGELYKISSGQLTKLAKYLEIIADGGKDLYKFEDFVQQFYWQLPFWGIPPLNPEKRNIGGKKGAALLKNTAAFIAHQKLKTQSEQKKAWKKLDKAFTDGILELPEPIPNNDSPYQSLDEFKTTLHEFIFKADADAKDKLMQADLLPVLKALKLKVDDPPKEKKAKLIKLTGMSLEIMLQAVWETLEAFRQERLGNRLLSEVLAGVRVIITHFKHDLADDQENGQDGEELARSLLLQGCLGGLDKIFEQLGWHLPIDADQARLPREFWEKAIPLTLDTNTVSFGTSRARPHVLLKVELAYAEGAQPSEPFEDDDSDDNDTGTTGMKPFHRQFRWDFGPTQPERVRYQCAKTVLAEWNRKMPGRWMLPAFRLPMDRMTALYFAADEDEANRLIAQALTDLTLVNLLDDHAPANVDARFQDLVGQVANLYRAWLEYYVEHGYYAANAGYFHGLTKAYMALAEAVLDNTLTGSIEILRRLYKAFLLIDDKAKPNDDYLRCTVALGISLPVIELDNHRTRFLGDAFPEVASALGLGHECKDVFEQVRKLAEIHRPLAGLVVDIKRTLSAEIKSFGLLHYLGERPDTEKSLAVQTLLREEESDDDEDVRDSVRPGQESGVVLQVIKDYLRFYPFAHDGLRILALHVEELATVLAGVNDFLRRYLNDSRQCNPDWPPFHCEVMVYTTSSSPMVMENRLAAWRDDVMESCRERNRPLRLTIGHRYAPVSKPEDRERLCELLRQEAKLYDVAFLFHFLEGKLAGRIDEVEPFQYDYNAANIAPFPICEYPRPIQQGDVFRRQTLLSNRRLRLQARHADLSARLSHPQNTHADHVIYGLIDYQPWQTVVEELHHKAQWVACIDPFVDKNLLCGAEPQHRRKIVGFASGLGDYGELNLTISTDQDTLQRLTHLVRGKLDEIVWLQQPAQLDAIASRVVGEAEAIIGLSSLHAVVGNGEKIREVVGFAAIHRALATPATLSQLLPVDALGHWFANSEVNLRPDLLQVSLNVRGEGELPLIQAVVIECKFAQHNPAHVQKATDQVCDGLSHLTQLFAPNRSDIGRMRFDRRYWWAQLQRAITTRSMVNLSGKERSKLDRALENLAEGYFEIAWQGVIFTFWTDDPGAAPVLTPLKLPASTLTRPFQAPGDFTLWHLALGYEGLANLFTHPNTQPLLNLSGKPAITVGVDVAKPTAPGPAPLSEPAAENPAPVVPDSAIPPQATPLPTESASNTPAKELPGTVLPRVEVISPVSLPTAAVPDRLLIGTRGNGDAVYWHYGHPQLNNRHLLIFGTAGSGKTYGIQCLLAEMAKQGLHSLIVDYTDGFLPQQIEPTFQALASPKNHFVITDKLPLNPFRRQQQILDPSIPVIEETPFQTASRVASIFTSVFETMGDQQRSTLIRVLEAGIGQLSNFTLNDLLPRLREETPYGETLASKLEPLIKSEPFREGGDTPWEQMLSAPENGVQILQLKGLSRDVQMMVTEFILWDLYDYVCNIGNKNRPVPLVLDEFQNLDRSSGSPIDKMIREGRKFGLSMLLATQTIKRFSQDECAVLFQAGHKLFFKPADTEIDQFAQLLSQRGNLSKQDWGQRLANLKKGECWSLGWVQTSSGALKEEAVLVSVTPLEKRFQ